MNWNPWRRIADLEAHVASRAAHIAELQRALDVSADRYDLVREMNAHLREALRLYRHNIEPAPVLMEYVDQPLPPMFPGLASD